MFPSIFWMNLARTYFFPFGQSIACSSPSSYSFLDSEQRIIASKVIKRFVIIYIPHNEIDDIQIHSPR